MEAEIKQTAFSDVITAATAATGLEPYMGLPESYR